MPYKDPEKQREADRRWREANPEKGREQIRRWRAAKAHRIFAASSEIETGLSQINDPKQGARLVRAFLRIATSGTLRLGRCGACEGM
jgi:hypothetical protein